MKITLDLSHEKNLLWAVVLTSSTLTLLPGCGIPKLRCALPGAAMPNSYQQSNGWNSPSTSPVYEPLNLNNGAGAYNDSSKPNDKATETDNKGSAPGGAEKGSDSKAIDPDDKTANSKGILGAFRLTSFVKPAASINLKEEEKKIDGQAAKKDADGNKTGKNETQNSNDPNANSSGSNNAFTMDAGISSPATSPVGVVMGIDTTENSAQLGWHQFFEDPVLTGLIDQALLGNQELKILGEEIQIACNEVYARSGEYRPLVTLGTSVGVEKPGQFTRQGAVEEQLQVAPGRSFPEPLPNFLVGTNVTWQIDIWKRLRNAQRAAAMRYLGTQEGRNYVITRLVADVAENYYELLAFDNRLVTLDRTIEIQEASLKTAQSLKEAGRATELPVQRFDAEVRKNQSEKLIIQQQIIQTENRINFLLGRYPQTVERSKVEYIDLNLSTLSVGVPAQLLRNRPDIRQAERVLQAAGLDVQVARARFYPALNLNAGLGYNAFNAGYLFRTPESLAYGVGGDLVAPLVNKRAIQAAYRTANAQQLQSVYEYQRTVLNAYTEVINQMNKVDNYGKSIEIKKQQLAALVGSVDSATKLFQNARGEYLDVLLSQRDMMEARMVLIETKQQQLSAAINTYQALGGGGSPGSFN